MPLPINFPAGNYNTELHKLTKQNNQPEAANLNIEFAENLAEGKKYAKPKNSHSLERI
jgi:hypothetical protein